MKNIHIIPTDNKWSRLYFNINDKEYQICENEKTSTILKPNRHIYITSDEEIKEGDWVLNTHTNDVYFLKGYYGIQPIIKKIILTTDQDLIKDGVQAIDDEFLEWFVKNPSCEEVEVVDEIIEDTSKDYIVGLGQPCTTIYKIIIPKEETQGYICPQTKLQCDDECCVSAEKCNLLPSTDVFSEPKQETLEQDAELEKIAMDKLKNKWEHLYTFGYPQKPFPTNYENDLNNVKVGLYEGAKWQQERMYSEEDMKQAFKVGFSIGYGSDVHSIDDKNRTFEKWFERNKKK